MSSWLMSLALFVLALVPRAIKQGTFVTVDEASHWFGRAEKFLTAIEQRDYPATYLVGHPGVTTTWLGAAGIRLHQALGALGWVDPNDPVLYRALMRLPIAVVTSLAVALAYPLLRRLFGGRVALLAALLWATEPFLIAHSQLLHTDALLTSFMTLALLAALAAFRFDHRIEDRDLPINWPLLIGSGVAGGLAWLTKAPSIVLPPMIALIALASAWRGRSFAVRPRTIGGRWSALGLDRAALRPRVFAVLVWGAVVVAVWFALWPATWSDPLGVLVRMYTKAVDEGASPHGWGNFFLGRAVADPGPLFYLVAIALRLTPWTLIGVALAGIAAFQRRPLPNRRALGLLLIFVLLFLAMMSALPKKFDRYILPVFPALDLFAAVGFVWLWDAIRGRRTQINAPRWIGYGVWLPIGAVLIANLAWYHPYEIAYYNPLLGGGRVAARTIPVGWGEGYEQVGAYLSAQPDPCVQPIAAWFQPALTPFVCAPVVPLDWALKPGAAGYAVLYIDQILRNDVPEVTQAFLGKETPVHTVRIHGIDYAFIYKLAPPVTHPAPTDFGSAIHFRGYDLDTSALSAGGGIKLNLHWEARGPVTQDRAIFVHVINQQGERVGQIDLPLVGANAASKAWQPGPYSQWNLPLPLPANLPAGDYWLALGVYDSADFSRLPLHAELPPNAPNDGADALVLGPIKLP